MCNTTSASDTEAMPMSEKGDLSCAILHYLSSVGVPVRAGKSNPSQGKAVSVPARRLFGVPLHSLPLSARAVGVPQFLVDACELLRMQLHVEGLFRKTGSVTRIKALKTRLEAGENCLHMALPCDVATLVKQFLRDLPEPLVPAELQGPLCQIQLRPEEDRGALTLLLTCLVPQANASTLRYFFGFLQDVAARCSQNKMDVANLAVVFAPNLFPGESCSRLDGDMEELLQTQAAVVELLISHASEIGIVPQSLLGKVQAAFSEMEHKQQPPPGPGDGRGGEAESRRRRRRRRSVGNIVTEALSKFKTGRALRAAPCPETKEGACQGNECQNDSALRTSFNSKRKASDDISREPELSVKKRKSASNSGCSDPTNEEVFEPADPMQGPVSPALVFSSSPSSPVFGIGSQPGSPRISTLKVQRRRSSGRKRPQRKHSIRTAPSCSPTPFERKDVERNSLHIFIQGSKDLNPLSPSVKVTEASGWLLTKKMAVEALEGPSSQQPRAYFPFQHPKEAEESSPGQSSEEDFPPHTDQVAPDTSTKHKNRTGASLDLDGVSRGLRKLALETPEGLLGGPAQVAPPLRQPPRALRRSLSWPEDLSTRDTAERGETDSFPHKVVPGDCSGLAEAEQPGAEVTTAGARQAGVPLMYVTPTNSDKAGPSESEPHDIPNRLRSSETVLLDDRGARADGFQRLSKVSRSSLKRFTLNFHRMSSQPNEELNEARPKRKGGRRFGRSLSHESGLPLRAEEDVKKKGAASQPPKSPLQSFRAYGRQLFISHKHWAMAFAGLRGKKESASPSPQETKGAAVDSQESFLGHRPDREPHSYRGSPKSPSGEPQLVAGPDFLNL